MAELLPLFLFVLHVSSCSFMAMTSSTSLSQETRHLLSFFQSLNISHPLHGWNASASSSSNPCSWTGITCDARNTSVIELDLSNQKLSGTISPSLGYLSNLHLLNLSFNSLSGAIPPSLFHHCSHLSQLSLSHNSLTGTLPSGFSNCTALASFEASDNGLTGDLPSDLGKLHRLQLLDLENNFLTGRIPASTANCTELQWLGLINNSLIGDIPIELSALRKMTQLRLSMNQLTGQIPVSILVNCTKLSNLEIEYNFLSGSIPPEIGLMPQVQYLWMLNNNLSGSLPVTIGNLTRLQVLAIAVNNISGTLPSSLGQLSQLQGLSFSYNRFSGVLPETLGNLTNLQLMRGGKNMLVGSIPPHYGQLVNATQISLGYNFLIGQIPPELTNCSRLVSLELQNNLLNGTLPPRLDKLKELTVLNLYSNRLRGQIPETLFLCRKLQNLTLDYNLFVGEIPILISQLSNLLFLSLSHNLFSGSLPQAFGGMPVLVSIDFSANNFSGILPSSLANCVELVKAIFSQNHFEGQIPAEFKNFRSLKVLDLSANSFSGEIPEFLSQINSLTFVNLSYNYLQGPIPEDGIFLNLTAGSFLGNDGLCGSVIRKPCLQTTQVPNFTGRNRHRRAIIVASVAASLAALVSILVLLCIRSKKKGSASFSRGPLDTSNILRTTNMLQMTVGDVSDVTSSFSNENVIGKGGLSTVYKGILPNGTHIAVKKLNLDFENLPESEVYERHRSFIAELGTLGKARHRNLVRVIGFCADVQMKALILELMPNGSLHKQLHEMDGDGILFRSWEANLKIVVGVAQALMYLHHECIEPILHCDIKPGNILLDEEMEPHLADFGLARILRYTEMSSGVWTSNFRGSFGYIAPEYGSTGRITAKGDVYSFGIVLLEIVTHRIPTVGEKSLPRLVQKFMDENKPEEVIYPSILQVADTNSEEFKQIIAVLKVGLRCSREDPYERPTMIDVVKMLPAIKRDSIRRVRTEADKS